MRSHKRCRLESPSFPKRVLDVSNLETTGIIRLVASVSHCWGLGPMLTTKSTNIAEHENGIKLSNFPRTFQEAMAFALKMGVRYIWIDSLCIIQDSAEDWETESKKMANIYTDGHFTIAASRSRGSEQGLYSESPPENIGEKMVVSSSNGKEYPFRFRKPIDHNTWPLLKRAWVYQERWLSRRIFHFAIEEIVWECMESTRCECSHAVSAWDKSRSIDSKALHHKVLASASSDDLADQWREMVTKYASMSLTYTKDIFPALSGLAKTMESRGMRDYCAGSWKEGLTIDLLWRMKTGAMTYESRPDPWR